MGTAQERHRTGAICAQTGLKMSGKLKRLSWPSTQDHRGDCRSDGALLEFLPENYQPGSGVEVGLCQNGPAAAHTGAEAESRGRVQEVKGRWRMTLDCCLRSSPGTWWYYGYDPETKQQSSQWKHHGSPRPKKACQVRSAIKTMLICFIFKQLPVSFGYLLVCMFITIIVKRSNF